MSNIVENSINKSIKNIQKSKLLIDKIQSKIKQSNKQANDKIHINFSPTIKIEVLRNDLVKTTVKQRPGPKPGSKKKTAKKKPGPKPGSKRKKKPGPKPGSKKKKSSKFLGLF